MRRCWVTIKNSGTGDIVFVDSHLDRGAWGDGQSPAQSANTIKPGEEKTFKSDRHGHIPIVQTWTGNQGWALYKTFADGDFGSAQEIYLRFKWNLPYISFSAEPPYCNGYKYDPRVQKGANEFDDRDKSPPNIHVNTNIGDFGHGDYVIDAIEAPPPPFYIYGGDNVSIQATFDVLDSRAPGSTKLPPFSNGTKPKAIPEPMINTNASMWAGTWGGDKIQASIVAQPDNMLGVIMSERHGRELQPSTTQVVGINRVLARSVLASMVNASVLHPSTDLMPAVVVQRDVGTAKSSVLNLERWSEDYAGVAKRHKELLSGLRYDRIQIGGDYLNLNPDAVLEMYRMVAGGEVVDIALRYRRPTTNQLLVAAASPVDEMLHYSPIVR